jgi:pimeloyl-ACP methyl ester carboxylesterase
VSEARPTSVTPLTGGTQARELHALFAGAHIEPPYLLVGHSYGGIVSREFAVQYLSEVDGMVLIDASSEPEIPVYDRLKAGPWDDGTVKPGLNQRIDIHATVSELEEALSLGGMPLVVITAGILQDRWLKTVPRLEAKAQTRLAGLSTNSVHVLDRGVGHFVPESDPKTVIAAVEAVMTAARGRGALASCDVIFSTVTTAECLASGHLGNQQV